MKNKKKIKIIISTTIVIIVGLLLLTVLNIIDINRSYYRSLNQYIVETFGENMGYEIHGFNNVILPYGGGRARRYMVSFGAEGAYEIIMRQAVVLNVSGLNRLPHMWRGNGNILTTSLVIISIPTFILPLAALVISKLK